MKSVFEGDGFGLEPNGLEEDSMFSEKQVNGLLQSGQEMTKWKKFPKGGKKKKNDISCWSKAGQEKGHWELVECA